MVDLGKYIFTSFVKSTPFGLTIDAYTAYITLDNYAWIAMILTQIFHTFKTI